MDNGQSERTRAATERACPELVEAAKALDLDGRYADEHCERVAVAIQKDMGLPVDGTSGQDARPCYDGDELRFRANPHDSETYIISRYNTDEEDYVLLGAIRRSGRFSSRYSSAPMTAAQLRRIAMVCEAVEGGGK